MRFFCIGKKDKSVELLQLACQQLKVDFKLFDPREYDFRQALSFTKGDLLYRTEVSAEAYDLERFLIDKKVTTFYRSYERSLSGCFNTLIYAKEKIPTPKTILRLTNNKKILAGYADYLGGFPIIIKAVGGSHGVGIMRIDSLQALFSLADFLIKIGGKYIMKQFIDVKTTARLIVLGDKVVETIEYVAPQGDFRSNEGKVPNVRKSDFSDQVKEIAIKATQALGLEFAGVDMMIDKNNNYYLTEVNFPCYFPRVQLLTKTDIAELMVRYLVDKSNKL